MAKKLAQKYVDFLDTHFDEDGSWSDLVQQLVDTFHITADYADKVIDMYIEM